MPVDPRLPPLLPSPGSLTTVPGLRVGHASDPKGATGFTVVLCEQGAVCGLDLRGGASSLRNPTVALPGHLVEKVDAVFFTGGSAFGLDAAAGVMRYLEGRRIGFPVRGSRVPIVTGAVLFDLAVGDPRRRPDPAMAYRACRGARASRRENVPYRARGSDAAHLAIASNLHASQHAPHLMHFVSSIT